MLQRLAAPKEAHLRTVLEDVRDRMTNITTIMAKEKWLISKKNGQDIISAERQAISLIDMNLIFIMQELELLDMNGQLQVLEVVRLK